MFTTLPNWSIWMNESRLRYPKKKFLGHPPEGPSAPLNRPVRGSKHGPTRTIAPRPRRRRATESDANPSMSKRSKSSSSTEWVRRKKPRRHNRKVDSRTLPDAHEPPLSRIKNDGRRSDRRPQIMALEDAQWSSFSMTSAYSSALSSSSSSPRSLILTAKIQPLPNASSLMVSGVSLSSSLISTTSPVTGE